MEDMIDITFLESAKIVWSVLESSWMSVRPIEPVAPATAMRDMPGTIGNWFMNSFDVDVIDVAS